jgi:hypothetical protein
MTAARRLAADVVGYSRLMGEDESGMARPVGRTAPRGEAQARAGSFSRRLCRRPLPCLLRASAAPCR